MTIAVVGTPITNEHDELWPKRLMFGGTLTFASRALAAVSSIIW